MAEMITIDKDALIRAIYSSTDASEVDARTIVDSVTAPPPAGAQQAVALLEEIKDWLDELKQANFDGHMPQSVFSEASALSNQIDALAAPAAAQEPRDAALLKLSQFAHTAAHMSENDMRNNLLSIADQLIALAATPAPEAAPADPMDWPLPCDVTVGHGTMRKGVTLRTLVNRMKTLYEMATGQDADAVAGRTLEERQALAAKFLAAVNPGALLPFDAWCCEKGQAAGKRVCDECAETSHAYSAPMTTEPDDTPLETGEGDAR